MVNDFLERAEAAVVHVRSRQGDVPQGRGFESARIRGQTRHRRMPRIRPEMGVQPVVAEQVVRELGAGLGVAMEAVPAKLAPRGRLRIAALPEENQVAVVFRVRELRFAAAPPVVLRVARDHRAQELRQSFRGPLLRDGLIPECGPEMRGVVGALRVDLVQGAQPLDRVGPGQRHFIGVRHGHQDLLFERQGATIPEIVGRPAHVDQCH